MYVIVLWSLQSDGGLKLNMQNKEFIVTHTAASSFLLNNNVYSLWWYTQGIVHSLVEDTLHYCDPLGLFI